MNIPTSWISDHTISTPSGESWSTDSGSKILINSVYPEYTSGKFIVELLSYLSGLSGQDEISVRTIDGNGDAVKIWRVDQLAEFGEYFDANANWGEWIFMPGSHAKFEDDLVGLLRGLSGYEYVIYLDLDAGLIAGLNPHLSKSI